MTNTNNSKKLILGSKSPRRHQLLTEAGFNFEIRILETDESFDPNMPSIEVAEHLALRKAEALRSTLQMDECMLTADSVVIVNDIIYNKPADYDEAVLMLSQLSNRTHTVATGVCLMTIEKTVTFTVTTNVRFDQINADEMDYYIKTHEPFDKAGGYGIQDWIGLCKVADISGSYSNVMGLPMREVYLELNKLLNK